MRNVSLTVNGLSEELELEPRELLVYVLRERLGLTGTTVGCDTSSCGACTVLLDGESVKSCTVLGVQADGHEITTIEGLAENGTLAPLQESFHRHHALQCGYCTPGMVLAATSIAIWRFQLAAVPSSIAPPRNSSPLSGSDQVMKGEIARRAGGACR